MPASHDRDWGRFRLFLATGGVPEDDVEKPDWVIRVVAELDPSLTAGERKTYGDDYGTLKLHGVPWVSEPGAGDAEVSLESIVRAHASAGQGTDRGDTEKNDIDLPKALSEACAPWLFVLQSSYYENRFDRNFDRCQERERQYQLGARSVFKTVFGEVKELVEGFMPGQWQEELLLEGGLSETTRGANPHLQALDLAARLSLTKTRFKTASEAKTAVTPILDHLLDVTTWCAGNDFDSEGIMALKKSASGLASASTSFLDDEGTFLQDSRSKRWASCGRKRMKEKAVSEAFSIMRDTVSHSDQKWALFHKNLRSFDEDAQNGDQSEVIAALGEVPTGAAEVFEAFTNDWPSFRRQALGSFGFLDPPTPAKTSGAKRSKGKDPDRKHYSEPATRVDKPVVPLLTGRALYIGKTQREEREALASTADALAAGSSIDRKKTKKKKKSPK